MANPPDFRDLNRSKNSKALDFASFKSRVSKGLGSNVGGGNLPIPPASPTPTNTPPASPTPTNTPVTPTPTETPVETPTPTNTPSASIGSSPTPTPSITSTPAALPFSLQGPTSSGYGVFFIALYNSSAIYFGEESPDPAEVPVSMDIFINGTDVASITIDSSRIGQPFKFVLDSSNPGSQPFYGNFTAGQVNFTTGTPLPTPSITPSITVSPTITNTPTVTETPQETPPAPTPNPTPTLTPSISLTPSITPTITPSITVSSTPQETPTPVATRTPTISITPTNTPSMTVGASPTPTPSVTPTLTPSLPFLDTYSYNETVAANPAQQEKYFIVNYGAVTGDPTGNFYITIKPNDTLVTIEAFYLDNEYSGLPYGTQFIPPTYVEDTFTFQISTFSVPVSAEEIDEFYQVVNPSEVGGPHYIFPEFGDFQVVFRIVAESGEPGTYNWELDTGAFVNINTTPTPTPSPTVTPTITNSETPPPTPSNTATPSLTPSLTIGATPTPTPTISDTPAPTPTISITPTISLTPSVTMTQNQTVYTSPVTAIPVNANLIQTFYVNVGKNDSELTVNFDPGSVSTNFAFSVDGDPLNEVVSTGFISSLSSFSSGIYPSTLGDNDMLIKFSVSAVSSPEWEVKVATTPLE